MAISASSLKLRYSGGSSNSDANSSLGGTISSVNIPDNTLGNLFNDVNDRDTTTTSTDYRGVYLINVNTVDTFYNAEVWVEDQSETGGAKIKVGTTFRDEIQLLKFIDYTEITGGNFTLQFDGVSTSAIPWDSDPDTLATSVASALNSLASLSGIIATAAVSNDNLIIQISFNGNDGNKTHPLIVIEDNNLTTATDPPVLIISSGQKGFPLNAVAVDILFSNNAPSDVTFVDTSETLPLSLGDLSPGDFIPLWFQRIIPADVVDIIEDSFTLQIQGSDS